MRYVLCRPIRALALGAALSAIGATLALADSHSCDQLRLTTEQRVPGISRDLPYDALDCAGISEVFLLTNGFDGTVLELNRRIEAVFRRYGLIN